jgi:hypothetical protein
MVARGFGRTINITTSGVKSPGIYPQLGISIGVRSGLTGFIGVLSRQVARHNVTIKRSGTGTLRNGSATRQNIVLDGETYPGLT